MSKADNNRNFVATTLFRDNYDKIFYPQEEGVLEVSNADLINDIDDKRIYQKDNSHGSDIKED